MPELYLARSNDSKILRFLQRMGGHDPDKGPYTLILFPLFSYAPIGMDPATGGYSVSAGEPTFHSAGKTDLVGLLDSSVIIAEGCADGRMADFAATLGSIYNTLSEKVSTCEKMYAQAVLGGRNLPDDPLLPKIEIVCERYIKLLDSRKKVFDMVVNNLLSRLQSDDVSAGYHR